MQGAVVDVRWLDARSQAWDDLVAQAATPNPFYAARVIEAHRTSGLVADAPAFAVVTDGAELLALLPLQPNAAWFGWRRAARAFASAYTVSSAPLVRPDADAAVFDALLGAIAGAAQSDGIVLPLLPIDSFAGTGLRDAAHRRGWPTAQFNAFPRAVLDRRENYEIFARDHLGKNRRKGLQRQRNRLSDLGRLAYRSAQDGDALTTATEAFLSLEAAGWKGRRGTALVNDPRSEAFARALFGAAAEPVGVRADWLDLDNRPIAVSLALVSGGTAWLLKTAYDETLRKCAPGLVLEDEIVRAMHAEGFCARLDSASLPGGVLEDLYPDREPMADLVIGLGMTTGAFSRRLRAEHMRREAITRLKRLKARLTRR